MSAMGANVRDEQNQPKRLLPPIGIRDIRGRTVDIIEQINMIGPLNISSVQKLDKEVQEYWPKR